MRKFSHLSNEKLKTYIETLTIKIQCSPELKHDSTEAEVSARREILAKWLELKREQAIRESKEEQTAVWLPSQS